MLKVLERFTPEARRVITLAKEEADAMEHNYIGTEHILLGLVREEKGLAARVLEDLDITADRVRAQVIRIVGRGDVDVAPDQIPFTPRTLKVLDWALREALSFGHDYVDTEHILRGVARENDGVASRVLLDFDVDPEDVLDKTQEVMGKPGSRKR